MTGTVVRARRVRSTVVALVLSCHPAPTVAVTCYGAALGAAAGLAAGTVVLLTVAVLAGQLSIGWSNDRLDAHRDLVAGRVDKPLAQGRLGRSAVDTAIVGAVVVTLACSFGLGWRPGAVHVAAVACGWVYNAGAKRTWWSWLPYALAFGALPAVATLARPDPRWPAGWVLAAGALLGVAAHLANVLPDLADDELTGVRGLPHRLGARASCALAAVLLAASSAVVVLGPAGPVSAPRWGALAGDAVLTVAVVVLGLRRPGSRLMFAGIVVVVAVDLALLLGTGPGLTPS